MMEEAHSRYPKNPELRICSPITGCC